MCLSQVRTADPIDLCGVTMAGGPIRCFVQRFHSGHGEEGGCLGFPVVFVQHTCVCVRACGVSGCGCFPVHPSPGVRSRRSSRCLFAFHVSCSPHHPRVAWSFVRGRSHGHDWDGRLDARARVIGEESSPSHTALGGPRLPFVTEILVIGSCTRSFRSNHCACCFPCSPFFSSDKSFF